MLLTFLQFGSKTRSYKGIYNFIYMYICICKISLNFFLFLDINRITYWYQYSNRYYRPTSTWACPYGRVATSHYEDSNTITFNETIGGKENPVIFPFDRWPVSLHNSTFIISPHVLSLFRTFCERGYHLLHLILHRWSV